MTNNDQFEERIRRSLDRKAESVRAEPDISTLDAPHVRSSTSTARRPPIMLALAAAVVLVLGATAMVVQAANERDQQVASEGGADNSTDSDTRDPGTTGTTLCEDSEKNSATPCATTTLPTTTVTPTTEPKPATSPSTTVAPDTTEPVTTTTSAPENEPEQPVCPEGFTDRPPPVPWSEANWGEYRVVFAQPESLDSDDPTEDIMRLGVWAMSSPVEDCYARLRDTEGNLVYVDIGSGDAKKNGLQCAPDARGGEGFIVLRAFSTDRGEWDVWATPGKLVGITVQYSDFESYVLTQPDDAEEIERAGTLDCIVPGA